MIRLSRKIHLALEAVVDVAYNARPDPVQAKDITRRQGIAQRYLEQVMQELVHAGILKGVRGPKGGYRLARERRRISVGDIVRVVGALENNGETEPESQSALAAQIIRPMLDENCEALLRQLDAISIEDLCQRAQGASIACAALLEEDFAI